MNRKTLIAAALLAAIAGGAAIAAPQTRTGLDANKDGTIDRAEAAKLPRLATKFDQLDGNKDGRLDTGERPQWKGKRGHGGRRHGMHGGGMERLDKDGDGRISRAEFDAGKAEREQRMAARGADSARMGGKTRHAFDFAAADGNRDGYLVRSELRAYHERQRPEREAEFAKRSAERFAAADINKDGKLSKLEVGEKMPRLEKSFAWMDENRDGFLSQAELKPQRHR